MGSLYYVLGAHAPASRVKQLHEQLERRRAAEAVSAAMERDNAPHATSASTTTAGVPSY